MKGCVLVTNDLTAKLMIANFQLAVVELREIKSNAKTAFADIFDFDPKVSLILLDWKGKNFDFVIDFTDRIIDKYMANYDTLHRLLLFLLPISSDTSRDCCDSSSLFLPKY